MPACAALGPDRLPWTRLRASLDRICTSHYGIFGFKPFYPCLVTPFTCPLLGARRSPRRSLTEPHISWGGQVALSSCNHHMCPCGSPPKCALGRCMCLMTGFRLHVSERYHGITRALIANQAMSWPGRATARWRCIGGLLRYGEPGCHPIPYSVAPFSGAAHSIGTVC